MDKRGDSLNDEIQEKINEKQYCGNNNFAEKSKEAEDDMRCVTGNIEQE